MQQPGDQLAFRQWLVNQYLPSFKPAPAKQEGAGRAEDFAGEVWRG